MVFIFLPVISASVHGSGAFLGLGLGSCKAEGKMSGNVRADRCQELEYFNHVLAKMTAPKHKTDICYI